MKTMLALWQAKQTQLLSTSEHHQLKVHQAALQQQQQLSLQYIDEAVLYVFIRSTSKAGLLSLMDKEIPFLFDSAFNRRSVTFKSYCMVGKPCDSPQVI